MLGFAGAAKASPEAMRMGRLYIQTACLMILFFSLGSLFQIVMATYGYPTYAFSRLSRLGAPSL